MDTNKILQLPDADLGRLVKQLLQGLAALPCNPPPPVPFPILPELDEDIYFTLHGLDEQNIVAFTVQLCNERDPSAAAKAYSRILRSIGLAQFKQQLAEFIGSIRQPGCEPSCRGSLLMQHYLKPCLPK